MRFMKLVFLTLTLALLTGSLLGPMTAMPAGAQTRTKPDGGGAVCAPVDREQLAAPYIFKFGLSGETLQQDFFNKENPNSYNVQGFRPTRLTGYLAGSENRFMTKWVKHGTGTWYSWFGMTGDQFHDRFNQLKGTHRPVDVSGYNTASGETRYAVIWQENTTGAGWKIHRDVSRPGMQDLVNQYAGTGWAPVRVEGYLRDGRLNFISIWERSDCRWKMHNQMTRKQYQDKLDEYSGTLRLIHLDAYNVDGEIFYAGIWRAQDGPGQLVRSNRDWYLYQRFFNNYRADGYVIDNFHAVDDPSGSVRYGGIWTYNQPLNIDENSSLAARVRYHVDRVPGRAGVAVIDLKSSVQIMHHADVKYGTSSTIKSAIVYALLRKADAEGINLDTTFLNVGSQYGSNGGDLLTENGLYSLSYLAQIMIDNSHNWATNRLIDYVGMDQINQELANLGLKDTRLNRYMTGSGAPSAQGQSGPVGDIKAGFDNFATPREFATMLQLIYANDGLLSQDSYGRFFAILGNKTKGYVPALLDEGVDPNWKSLVTIYNKAGSNQFEDVSYGEFAHRPQIDYDFRQASDAGYFEFDADQMVVFAVFVDEWDYDAVDPKGSDAVRCIAYEVVKDYSATSTGVVPDECAYP